MRSNSTTWLGRNDDIPRFYFTKKWAALRSKVLNRDHNVCQYCGGVGYQADHIVPRGRKCQGPDTLQNLVCCCSECNKAAGSMCFPSFQAKRAFILKRRGIPLKSGKPLFQKDQ